MDHELFATEIVAIKNITTRNGNICTQNVNNEWKKWNPDQIDRDGKSLFVGSEYSEYNGIIYGCNNNVLTFGNKKIILNNHINDSIAKADKIYIITTDNKLHIYENENVIKTIEFPDISNISTVSDKIYIMGYGRVYELNPDWTYVTKLFGYQKYRRYDGKYLRSNNHVSIVDENWKITKQITYGPWAEKYNDKDGNMAGWVILEDGYFKIYDTELNFQFNVKVKCDDFTTLNGKIYYTRGKQIMRMNIEPAKLMVCMECYKAPLVKMDKCECGKPFTDLNEWIQKGENIKNTQLFMIPLSMAKLDSNNIINLTDGELLKDYIKYEQKRIKDQKNAIIMKKREEFRKTMEAIIEKEFPLF